MWRLTAMAIAATVLVGCGAPDSPQPSDTGTMAETSDQRCISDDDCGLRVWCADGECVPENCQGDHECPRPDYYCDGDKCQPASCGTCPEGSFCNRDLECELGEP